MSGETTPEPMRCSDPPEESCSDANCPVHGDRYSDDFWDADEMAIDPDDHYEGSDE